MAQVESGAYNAPYWRTVAALSAVCLFGLGGTISALGLYFDPIRKDLSWSSAQVSSLASAFLIAMSLFALFAGHLLDRYGAKRVMLLGSVLAGGGLIMAGGAQDRWSLLSGFILSGAGVGACTYVPSMFVATGTLKNRIGLAIGIVLSAASVGSALLPAIIAYGIVEFGWRTAIQGSGIALIAIAVPLVLLSVPGRLSAKEVAVDEAEGLSLLQALRSFRYWSICLTIFLFFLGFMGLYLHIIPYLTETGFTLKQTAIIYGLSNGISALGLVALGWAADRYGVQLMLVINLLLNAAAIPLLALVSTTATGMTYLGAFIIIWGVTQGAPTQLCPILMAKVVGRKNFGVLSGISGLFHGIANAIGPIAVGAIRDTTGSYIVAFYFVASVVASAGVAAVFAPNSLMKDLRRTSGFERQ